MKQLIEWPHAPALQLFQISRCTSDKAMRRVWARGLKVLVAACAVHMQGQFRETIRYINPISGTQATSSMLNVAEAAEREVPILQKGSIICILPSEDVLMDRAAGVGERLPFWLAVVDEDEDAPVDSYGARINAIEPEDEFSVHWLSVFNSQGRLSNSVVGSWVPRCKHPDPRGRVHACNE
eukprot:3535903-Pleurochrysis_carterae.AAC.1